MSPEVQAAIRAIEAEGYAVEFREWVEDAETPGLLGMAAGVTIHTRRAVKVKTHGVSDEMLVAVLRHELEHVQGAAVGSDCPELGLVCGGSRGPACWALHAPHTDGPEVRMGHSGGYFVRSASTPGAWWFVWGTDCSCPAGQAAVDTGSQKLCRHKRAVLEFVQEENRRHKRPLAPPNVSAFVD